ncbi:MAG: glycosyltransferase family 39 protein, partial [Planctomycetota bacterium]
MRSTIVDRAERWVAAHRGWIVLAIVCLSSVVRIVYFAQLQGGPLMVQHRWDETDMHYYHGWARAVVGGDWLSSDVRPPLHTWHRRVAAEHFRLHPDQKATLGRGAAADDDEARDRAAAAALWDRWCGGGRFYQDPLYPYLLAMTYAVCGEKAACAFLWQMVLGVASILLVYSIARRCLGELVAAAAAVLASLYAPALFYEMILLRDCVIVFAGLGLAWLVGRAVDHPTPRVWSITGLAFGITMALKAHFLLFLVAVVAMMAWDTRRRPKELLRWVLPLAAGVAVGVAPLAARNLAVGTGPLSTAGNGTPSFVIANGVNATDTMWDLGNATRILGDTDCRFLPAVLATVRTHPGVSSYLRLVWSKVTALWHWYEKPNNENFYYYRLHSSILRRLPLTFRVLAPLALVGLVLSLVRWRSCWPLYGLALAHAVVLLAVFPLSRYRVAFAVALIPFAALVIVSLARWLANRQWPRAVAALVAVAAIAAWTARPLSEGRTLIRAADCRVPVMLHYGPMFEEAEGRRDWAACAQVLAEALR